MQPKEKIRTSNDEMKLGIMKKVFIYSKVRINLYRYLKKTPVSEKSVKYRRYVVKISKIYRIVQRASDGKFYEVLTDSKNIMGKEK